MPFIVYSPIKKASYSLGGLIFLMIFSNVSGLLSKPNIVSIPNNSITYDAAPITITRNAIDISTADIKAIGINNILKNELNNSKNCPRIPNPNVKNKYR